MSSTFPAAIDALAHPVAGQPMNNPSQPQAFSDMADAVEAVETKLGVNNSTDHTSIDYRVVQLEAERITWRGSWSGLTAYVVNDVVTDGGASYICIFAHTNHEPPNATYWNVLAQKGDAGAAGAAGATGATGATGPAGPGIATGGTTGQTLTKKSNADYDTQWTTAISSFNTRTGAVTLTSGDVTGALGFTPGTGTVTSVGLSLPNILTVTGSPVTTSGTLTATLANQSANLVFAGPSSGGAAAPTFRTLVAADIPDISGTYAKLAASNTFTATQIIQAAAPELRLVSSGNSQYAQLTRDASDVVSLTNQIVSLISASFPGGTADSGIIAIPADANLAGSPISISFWCNFADASPANYMGVVGHSNGSSWSQGWGFYYFGGDLRFFIQGYSSHFVSAGITPNQWNHICGTWDGTTMKFYLNASLTGTGSYSGAMTTSDLMAIGHVSQGDSGDPHFKGNISDVRVYKGAAVLSLSDVQTLYAAGNPSGTLYGRWKLGEGSGTVALDAAGSNNGILGSAVTWVSSKPVPLQSYSLLTALQVTQDGTVNLSGTVNAAITPFTVRGASLSVQDATTHFPYFNVDSSGNVTLATNATFTSSPALLLQAKGNQGSEAVTVQCGVDTRTGSDEFFFDLGFKNGLPSGSQSYIHFYDAHIGFQGIQMYAQGNKIVDINSGTFFITNGVRFINFAAALTTSPFSLSWNVADGQTPVSFEPNTHNAVITGLQLFVGNVYETPTTALGISLDLGGSDSTTVRQVMGRVIGQWNNATHATRAGDLILYGSDYGGDREGVRVRATGTGTQLGFLAATPVSVQSVGAAATDAASTQTLANNLRMALINFGLCKT